MTNIEKYNKVFMDILGVAEDQLEELKYQDGDWDSVGHMELMAELEDTFNIELDADDIIDFSSYQKGREILENYKVQW